MPAVVSVSYLRANVSFPSVPMRKTESPALTVLPSGCISDVVLAAINTLPDGSMVKVRSSKPCAGAFWMTAWGRDVWQFVLGSRVELRKMVWQSLPDTRRTTLIVFLFVAAGGVFFWIVDWLLAWGTRHLLGTGA